MSDPLSNPFATQTDEYIYSDEADEQVGEIHLDGIVIPIQDQVGVTNLATLPQRLTFGDYTLASDNLISVWVQSDWTGGGQVEDLREASHAERFRHATTETRYPRMLSQPPETLDFVIAGTPDEAVPIGDYDDDGDGTDTFWVAFDTDLCSWSEEDQDFTVADTLTSFPVGKGVVFDDELWIPLGSSGYDRWDGTNITNSTAVTPIWFVEWDDKLVALEHDGQVSIWDGATWTSPTALKLRGNRVPRGLVVWWSADRFPTVYVITNRDVWAVDFLVPILYLTGLHFPVHPDQGLGFAAWRDDAMYVSVGVGVHQLSLGMVISAMGLDRDDGLPGEFRGRIVDMEPEYNGLLALVEGLSVTEVTDEDIPSIEETMLRDDAMIVPTASSFARSTLQRWTGLGWHTVWESMDATGVPTRVMVSQADDAYRLWWGYAGRMYTQVLRRTFHNPRQGAIAGIDRFASESYLRTGRFDANLTPLHKLASHMEFHLDAASTGEIDVSYSSDHFDGYRYLGTVSGTGQQFVRYDLNADGFNEGDSYHWIEFQYTLRNTDPLETVILNWVSLYFVVRPLQAKSWQAIAMLDSGDEQHQDVGFREAADFLDGLTTVEHFSTFKHRDQMYRVLVAQTRGSDRTGDDLRGSRTFSIVEVNDHAPIGGE